jgi:hypothetical protein
MYLRIKDACFINYMNFKSKEHFLDAFATAQILWLVYGILSQYRLMIACGKEKIISFQPGRLSNSLRELKAACIGD